MTQYSPLIVIEIVMIFGGALAFAWWQFRDLRREREKRERRQAEERRAAEQAARTPASAGADDAA